MLSAQRLLLPNHRLWVPGMPANQFGRFGFCGDNCCGPTPENCPNCTPGTSPFGYHVQIAGSGVTTIDGESINGGYGPLCQSFTAYCGYEQWVSCLGGGEGARKCFIIAVDLGAGGIEATVRTFDRGTLASFYKSISAPYDCKATHVLSESGGSGGLTLSPSSDPQCEADSYYARFDPWHYYMYDFPGPPYQLKCEISDELDPCVGCDPQKIIVTVNDNVLAAGCGYQEVVGQWELFKLACFTNRASFDHACMWSNRVDGGEPDYSHVRFYNYAGTWYLYVPCPTPPNWVSGKVTGLDGGCVTWDDDVTWDLGGDGTYTIHVKGESCGC